MLMKNSSYTIGNQTRNLPACCATRSKVEELMDVKVVGATRENLFLGGREAEEKHYLLKFLGFVRLSFFYDRYEYKGIRLGRSRGSRRRLSRF
jgi:hypothetical protein